MKIAIATDHNGVNEKKELIRLLNEDVNFSEVIIENIIKVNS